MTLWNVELFSVTDALITLQPIKLQEIKNESNTIIVKNYSLVNSLFIWELWK